MNKTKSKIKTKQSKAKQNKMDTFNKQNNIEIRGLVNIVSPAMIRKLFFVPLLCFPAAWILLGEVWVHFPITE